MMTQELFDSLADVNGQISFACAVFHDEEMTLSVKIEWLRVCADSLIESEAKEAQEYLNQLQPVSVLSGGGFDLMGL
jgi:hypothetical protein